MKTIFRLITAGFFALLLASQVSAQKVDLLDFDKNGEFKIVQFTDTHINQKDEDISLVLDVINSVVKSESPDLIVFTGDIVTEDDPRTAYKEIAELMQSYNTKWVVVLGNHDDEHNTSRMKIAKLLTTFPNCLNQVSTDIFGTTNFTLSIGEKKKQALLYFLDSNAYSNLKPKVEGYGWFDNSQINWYKKQSQTFTEQNNGNPIPALAFFHIPLPEYNQVWDTDTLKKVGSKNEDVCCPELNTGMFAAMVEAGDVMGTFVGHDHVNDYIGVLYDIALTYGRCSGVNNAYGELPSGGRVILLTKGKREFATWIREANGKKVLEANYPKSFQ
ncbi:metallophosphoesterase family protein [uncultured Draconibacterium sp.]|uniref:metallophosphoesterase family protein n=1 Tax=uncultured Draconibacterium sp. TaxID=1573823 RepID=UPI0032176FAD